MTKFEKTKRTKLGFIDALNKLKINEFLQIPCSNGSCIKIEPSHPGYFHMLYHSPANTVLPQKIAKTDFKTLKHVVIAFMR